jgi:hypothetical protein
MERAPTVSRSVMLRSFLARRARGCPIQIDVVSVDTAILKECPFQEGRGDGHRDDLSFDRRYGGYWRT